MINNIKILFVCMGNICRSPAAQAVLKSMAEKENLAKNIEVDSAGTIDYHTGESPDPRMKSHAVSRGYFLNHKARKFDPDKDFEKYDYIITMDNEILNEIHYLDSEDIYSGKIHKITEYCRYIKADEVPDPYPGGPESFEKVMDILVDACRGLMNRLKNELKG